MKITVAGRHINLGQSLEEYVTDKLKEGILKYLKDVNHAEIVFSKDGFKYLSTILITEGHGLGVIRSNFESDEIYHAFDGALIRLEKQLRKHKERYKDHQAKKLMEIASGNETNIIAKKYIISSNEESHSADNQHLIIAEKTANIENLEVSEAVMKMDLTHVPALLFRNKSNDRLNLVFYRADGNISWIDPEF